MGQNHVQVTALLFGFIIYTTLKGNLRRYLQVLGVR